MMFTQWQCCIIMAFSHTDQSLFFPLVKKENKKTVSNCFSLLYTLLCNILTIISKEPFETIDKQPH